MRQIFKISIFLFWSNLLFSQTKYPYFSFGLMAGINQSTFIMPNNYYLFAKKYNSSLGNNFGLITKFSISNNLSFDSGLKYYYLKSNTNKPELIFQDDFVVIDEKINYFDGKLFINSSVECSSIRIPIQVTLSLLNSDKINLFLFGGIFKDFILKFSNNSIKIAEFIPIPANEKLTRSAEKNLIQNYNSILQNYNLSITPDNEEFGYNFGLGLKYHKVELSIDFNRTENTFDQGAIYRFNSTSLNLKYFY